MKLTILGSLAVALILATASQAGGRRDYVSVPFSAAQVLTVRGGDSIDGSVKFIFADEKSPAKGGAELSAKGSSFHGEGAEGKCALAVAAAFVTFQKRALKEGYNAVVDIRTYSESDRFSSSRKECQCVVGGIGARTTVKGRLAKI
jgi:hypothetical protein